MVSEEVEDFHQNAPVQECGPLHSDVWLRDLGPICRPCETSAGLHYGVLAGNPGCDEVGEEEKHRAALNGGH